jgi:hypothetical protein
MTMTENGPDQEQDHAQSVLQEYAERIRPLLPLARRAYGPRDQQTPAHEASREYTRLLVEFRQKDGSLIDLAKELEVAYSGLRRRVFTADVPTMRSTRRTRGTISVDDISAAADRVRRARTFGSEEYHKQLYEEFMSGMPMNTLAKKLGISNAGPLYYGVQRHHKRLSEIESSE